ncbi:hypothetical protein BD770DRAFT_398342 [Pilaira anomala]|nr:hypothetical protein BD770DRAFT_398342 [Pilaira anomala]
MQSTGYYPTSQQAYLVQQQHQQQHQQQQQQQQQQQSRRPQLNQVILEEPLDEEEEELEDVKKPMRRSGRRKIKIEYIEDKTRRHITFSKRKAGIMKKAYELSTLTGTQVLLLVVSETGLVYTFTTPKLQPLVTKPEGKNLIQSCLNAPDTTNLVEGNQSSMIASPSMGNIYQGQK